MRGDTGMRGDTAHWVCGLAVSLRDWDFEVLCPFGIPMGLKCCVPLGLWDLWDEVLCPFGTLGCPHEGPRGSMSILLPTIAPTASVRTSRPTSGKSVYVAAYRADDLATNTRDLGELIASITTNVVPDSWEERGGPGKIGGFAKNHSLIIQQSRKNHKRVASYLAQMRAKGAAEE